MQVIAASNRNLSQRVQAGAFRSDLYHRITVFTLELPPLRARKEDLDDLVPLFVAEYNVKAGKSVRAVPRHGVVRAARTRLARQRARAAQRDRALRTAVG